MTKPYKILFILLLLAAQQVLAGGVFSGRLPSPRAAAMGNAHVALANDVWAAWYNPAGLAQIENLSAGLAFNQPYGFEFFKNGYVSLAAPLSGKFGSAAITIEAFQTEYGGNILEGQYSTGFSHGFYLMNDIHSSLALGYNLKYYYWTLGRSVQGVNLGSGGTFGMDLGLLASIYHRTYIGAYVYNFNSPQIGSVVKSDLPRLMTLGVAYRPVTGLTTSLTLEKQDGYDSSLLGGLEFTPYPFIALRFGAGNAPNRFSAGFGLNYSGFIFDYSFQSHPVLAETHQFGLQYQFKK